MLKIKNGVEYFVKTGFFHIFGSSIINKAVLLLNNIIVVRILTKEEYGIFTYSWNIYNLVILLNGLGIASAVLQLCSERSSDENFAKQICAYSSRFGMGVEAVVAIIMLLLGTVIPLQIEGAGILLRLLCFLPAFRFLFDLITSYLRAQKRNQDFAKINTCNTVVLCIMSIIGAVGFKEKGMVVGYYIAYLVSILWGVFKLKVPLFARCEALKKDIRTSLKSIGMVSMCNNGLSQLLYLVDIFVLGILDPQETLLASYRVATIIPSALPFITMALVAYVYPYFAEHRLDGKWCLKRYQQCVTGLGTVNFVIAGVLFIAAPQVISVFFGEMYLDALPVFRVLIVNFFISGTFRMLSGNLLVTQRKLKFNLIVAVISGCINIVADFLFVSWWGAMGAAIATVLVVVITSVANTCYLICTFKRNAVKVD